MTTCDLCGEFAWCSISKIVAVCLDKENQEITGSRDLCYECWRKLQEAVWEAFKVPERKRVSDSQKNAAAAMARIDWERMAKESPGLHQDVEVYYANLSHKFPRIDIPRSS